MVTADIVVSFIIPAHNEERLLGQTLHSLDQAARTLALPFEVLVVDDSSTDRTSAIHRHCFQDAAIGKLRAHSAREVLGTMARLAFTAGRSVRRREGLDVWYGERRPDPESEPEPDELDLYPSSPESAERKAV